MRQVYKGEIEEKLLSRSLQPLNEAIMNTYEKTVKHYFRFLCLNLCKAKINRTLQSKILLFVQIKTITKISKPYCAILFPSRTFIPISVPITPLSSKHNPSRTPLATHALVLKHILGCALCLQEPWFKNKPYPLVCTFIRIS